MADYYTHTVIQPPIPAADMTPLERLLLGEIFTAEPQDDGVYFYAEERPADLLYIARAELDAALAASRAGGGTAVTCVTEQLLKCSDTSDNIDLDVSGTSWEFIFQDIVRRSPTLRYVSAISCFDCSKMRSDAFGGIAVLITADRILGETTNDLLTDFLAEAGLEP